MGVLRLSTYTLMKPISRAQRMQIGKADADLRKNLILAAHAWSNLPPSKWKTYKPGIALGNIIWTQSMRTQQSQLIIVKSFLVNCKIFYWVRTKQHLFMYLHKKKLLWIKQSAVLQILWGCSIQNFTPSWHLFFWMSDLSQGCAVQSIFLGGGTGQILGDFFASTAAAV